MNTENIAPAATEIPAVTEVNAPAKPAKASKPKAKAKVTEVTKDSVLAKVKSILDGLAKEMHAAQQSAIVEDAHRTLYSFAPDVEFSSNLEQKKAQRLALREKRASLGFAQANLLIVSALQNVKGAESSIRYNVRTLANGQVAGTTTEVIKTAKRSGRSGIRT